MLRDWPGAWDDNVPCIGTHVGVGCDAIDLCGVEGWGMLTFLALDRSFDASQLDVM